MRLRIFLILLGAVLVAAAFTFPMWQPLVQDQSAAPVEVFPGLAPQYQTEFLSLPQEQQRAYQALAEQDRDKAVAMITAALAPRIPLPEEDQAMPEMNAPITIASGTFQNIDAVRWGQGTVNVYQEADNKLKMRFEDFSAPNGPDLNVYLAVTNEPKTFAQMSANGVDAVELEPLKTTVGSQNYDLPDNLDFTLYHSVVIYSPSLDMIYTYAPLFVRQ